jgi:hypothetical protein
LLFHEDGDAVMALNLRKSFSTLNIIPGFDYLGKCFLSKLTSYRPDVDIDRHTSQLTEELIMISFAGAVTERIRCGGKWNEGAGKDYEVPQIWQLANAGLGKSRSLMNLLEIRATLVLRQERRQVM